MKTPSNYALRLPASLKKTAEYFTARATRGDKKKALRFLRRKGGEAPRALDERD